MTYPLRSYFRKQFSTAQGCAIVVCSIAVLFLTGLVVAFWPRTGGMAAWAAKSADFMPHGYSYIWRCRAWTVVRSSAIFDKSLH